MGCKLNKTFFAEHSFLSTRTTEKLWLFYLSICQTFFSKLNKVSLSLQEKLLVLFVTNEKIQTLKEIRTLENSYLPLWTDILTLKDIAFEIGGDTNNCNFFMLK